MNKYIIYFNRTKRNGEENIFSIEMERGRFTSRELKGVVLLSLLDLASDSSENKYLSAYIMCNGKTVLTVKCDTKVDGSRIDATICAARPREVFRKLRTVNIAS